LDDTEDDAEDGTGNGYGNGKGMRDKGWREEMDWETRSWRRAVGGGRYNRWKGGSSSSEKDPALKATIEKKRKRRIGQKIEVSGQDTRLLSAVRCAKLSN
jgi:hypothetical protein